MKSWCKVLCAVVVKLEPHRSRLMLLMQRGVHLPLMDLTSPLQRTTRTQYARTTQVQGRIAGCVHLRRPLFVPKTRK